MNMSRTELIHMLQLCEVTNIETDDPLCRLHHRKLCDLVSSNAVPSVMLCLAECSACEIPRQEHRNQYRAVYLVGFVARPLCCQGFLHSDQRDCAGCSGLRRKRLSAWGRLERRWAHVKIRTGGMAIGSGSRGPHRSRKEIQRGNGERGCSEVRPSQRCVVSLSPAKT